LRLQRPVSPKCTAAHWQKDIAGLTSIEYALIASVVSIAIAAVVFLLGGQVNALYQQIVGALAG